MTHFTANLSIFVKFIPRYCVVDLLGIYSIICYSNHQLCGVFIHLLWYYSLTYFVKGCSQDSDTGDGRCPVSEELLQSIDNFQ